VTVGFLLDTNVISELARHPHGRLADRIAAVGEQHVCTSIIVAAELRQDRNDLLFGMPLAPSPSFANDFTWTCELDRAPARGRVRRAFRLSPTMRGRQIGVGLLCHGVCATPVGAMSSSP
jgi:hypothetical protein